MSKTSYTAGHLDNHFAADSNTKSCLSSNFSRLTSTLGSSHFESGNSPKPGAALANAGLSLPTSPSNFSPSLDNIFKPDGFVCSSPKQSRKVRNTNPAEDMVDFLPTNLMFNYAEKSVSDLKNNSISLDSSYHTSRESNTSEKDSFIAQVTRDLAKMSALDKCLSDSAPGSKSYASDNFSLFKS